MILGSFLTWSNELEERLLSIDDDEGASLDGCNIRAPLVSPMLAPTVLNDFSDDWTSMDGSVVDGEVDAAAAANCLAFLRQSL
jgi:hypothetical protein